MLTSLGGRLAGNAGLGIDLEAGVQDGIGDLVTVAPVSSLKIFLYGSHLRDLVGVALANGLGGEEESLLACAIDAVGNSAVAHDCGVGEEVERTFLKR